MHQHKQCQLVYFLISSVIAGTPAFAEQSIQSALDQGGRLLNEKQYDEAEKAFDRARDLAQRALVDSARANPGTEARTPRQLKSIGNHRLSVDPITAPDEESALISASLGILQSRYLLEPFRNDPSLLKKMRELVDDIKRHHAEPADIQYSINLAALINLRAEEYEESLALFRTLNISKVPLSERYIYYFNRAVAFEKTGNFSAAFRGYIKALQLNGDFSEAEDGANAVAARSAYGTEGGAARICATKPAILDEKCFDKVLARFPGSLEVLAVKIQALQPASFDEGLEKLRTYETWRRPISELQACPRVPDVKSPFSDFPSWTSKQALAIALVSFSRSKEPPEYRQATQAEIGALVAIYLAAWNADPTNAAASTRLASLMQRDWKPPSFQSWADLVGKVAQATVDPATLGMDEEAAWDLSLFHTSLGEMLIDLPQRCDVDSIDSSTAASTKLDALNPARQWRYAIDSEMPGTPKNRAPRRYLAECYLHSSNPRRLQARGQYEDEIDEILREQQEGRTAANNDLGLLLRFRLYRWVYPGAAVRLAAQDGIQLWLDSPRAWGQGAVGFSKRLGSSFATRGIRQALALGIDSQLHQSPMFLKSYDHRVTTRLLRAMSQTFVSQNDRLRWQPAYSRIGSAFESEAISQLWRPSGTGLGDRNRWSWAARGGFVLAGDTASNIFREFLPRHGGWAKLIRPFL